MARTLFANPANRTNRLAAVWLAPLLVLALWAADAGAQSSVLVSNVAQSGVTISASKSVTNDIAQRFTTGANVWGYTLTSVEIRLGALLTLVLVLPVPTTAAPRVRLFRGGDDGKQLGRGREAGPPRRCRR